MIIYNNLRKGLIDRGIKKTDLISRAGISLSTLASMGKNQSVSLEMIARVGDALDCEIGDVVTIKNQKKRRKPMQKNNLRTRKKKWCCVRTWDARLEEVRADD